MPDRIIRESICMSETLNQLSDFEERFWHRLIVNCDDFGRFDAREAVLKGRLFPLMDGKTKKDMADALRTLASVGLVELYEVDGKPFLHVVSWSRYQRPRAKRSKFPAPDGACCHLTADAAVFGNECDKRESISGNGDGNAAPAGESAAAPAVPAAVEACLEKLGLRLSERSREELAAFAGEMGPEVCQRAMDAALDAQKASWPYIRAILRAKREQGVRSLADWDALEEKRRRQGESPWTYEPGDVGERSL